MRWLLAVCMILLVVSVGGIIQTTDGIPILADSPCVTFHDEGGADNPWDAGEFQPPVRLCGDAARGSCDNARKLVRQTYRWEWTGNRVWWNTRLDRAYLEQVHDCERAGA